jgi:hypothetical protein
MKWYSVEKDGPPKKDAPYIIHSPSADPKLPLIMIGWYDPRGFEWSLIPKPFIKGITHWMRLPKPPKQIRL